MSFDGIKTLGAYDMFHTAGILGCCFGVNAQAYQPAGEELVTFIYFFCDFRPSGVRVINPSESTSI